MEATESYRDRGEAESGWTPEAEALLGNWRNRVHAAQSAYYEETERLWRWHYLIGIPVVIMSTVVGSTVFTDRSAGTGIPDVVIGALGGLAAILAGLQTFLKLAEAATRHEVAASWYAAIRRDIEQLQALPRHLRGDVRVCLDSIRKDMNKVSQNAPALGEAFGSEWGSGSASTNRLGWGHDRRCDRPRLSGGRFFVHLRWLTDATRQGSTTGSVPRKAPHGKHGQGRLCGLSRDVQFHYHESALHQKHGPNLSGFQTSSASPLCCAFLT